MTYVSRSGQPISEETAQALLADENYCVVRDLWFKNDLWMMLEWVGHADKPYELEYRLPNQNKEYRVRFAKLESAKEAFDDVAVNHFGYEFAESAGRPGEFYLLHPENGPLMFNDEPPDAKDRETYVGNPLYASW